MSANLPMNNSWTFPQRIIQIRIDLFKTSWPNGFKSAFVYAEFKQLPRRTNRSFSVYVFSEKTDRQSFWRSDKTISHLPWQNEYYTSETCYGCGYYKRRSWYGFERLEGVWKSEIVLSPSHPLFPFEPDKADDHDNDRDCNNNGITVPPFQLWHIAKVHAIPACDER